MPDSDPYSDPHSESDSDSMPRFALLRLKDAPASAIGRTGMRTAIVNCGCARSLPRMSDNSDRRGDVRAVVEDAHDVAALMHDEGHAEPGAVTWLEVEHCLLDHKACGAQCTD